MSSSLSRLYQERPSTIPTPAPDGGEQVQPKPKPRTDSGTGTAAGIANPANKGNPPREQSELNGYCNSGTQNIKGLTNLTGLVEGDRNGIVNLGKMMASATADRGTNTHPPTQPDPNNQYKLEVLRMLLDKGFSFDGGKSDLATPQSSSPVPPGSGKGTQGNDFNTGTQNITGLSNLTGNTVGNDNGIINFDELRY